MTTASAATGAVSGVAAGGSAGAILAGSPGPVGDGDAGSASARYAADPLTVNWRQRSTERSAVLRCSTTARADIARRQRPAVLRHISSPSCPAMTVERPPGKQVMNHDELPRGSGPGGGG